MTDWIFETLVATTVLMLIILAIRGPVAARFGPRAAYLLWLAPALRMVMPPLPAEWTIAPVSQAQDAVIVMVSAQPNSAMALTAPESALSWAVVLGMIWLGGAAVFFARQLILYRRFVRRALLQAQPIERSNRIAIAASPAITSPLALGIVGKMIIVPHDFSTRFSAIEQRLAMAHELTHHRRGDPGINLLALLMLALHWFNPIAHIAHRAFRLDQEAACDAIVLDGASPIERHAYGTALFKAATGNVPLAICAMATATTLKARLRHIIANPRSGAVLRLGTLIVGLVVISGVLLTASNGVAAADPASVAPEPRITIYRGGVIDAKPEDVDKILADAKTRRENSEKAITDAERAADAASEAADKASEDAQSDAEHANADVARAKADLAQASADLARATAEASRRNIESAMRSAAIPEPPAPPAAPASPSGRAIPVPPAPEISAGNTNCPKSTKRQVIRTVQRGTGAKAKNVEIVICYPNIGEIRKSALQAMKAARLTIANEAMLGEAERASALASLDREIRTFAESGLPR